MFRKRLAGPSALVAVLVATTLIAGTSRDVAAQASPSDQEGPRNPLHFKVNDPLERLELIVRSSRILTLDYRVPRMLANNAEIIKVTPLSPNQIQVSALKPGVTQLTLWDEKDRVMAIDVIVYGDSRELDNILKVTFPEASIKVIPLASSVMLSGYVPEVDMVARIVRTAEDYYPKVVNNLTVGGTQKILLHVKVMEVSRTKLRKLGFDWSTAGTGGFSIGQNAAGLLGAFVPGPTAAAGNGGATVSFGVLGAQNQFTGFIEALRQYNMVKILAEPTLVTVSGRPATFNVGGEFPVIVPQSLGTVSVQYRQFGTRVDFVPLVLGRGSVRLEVRPQVTEIDRSTAVTIGNTTVPGIRARWVDTAVEMKVGQTFALAGLLQSRVETENRGLPFLADLPWAGVLFRRVQENVNEVELLITVTPEFAEAVDPQEMPECMPGQLTTSPNDRDLYFRGYLEVPKCCDTPNSSGGAAQYGGDPGMPSAHPSTYDAAQRRPAGPQAPQTAPTQVSPASQATQHRGPQYPQPVHVAPVAGRSSRPATASRPGVPRGAGDGNLLGPLGYDELK